MEPLLCLFCAEGDGGDGEGEGEGGGEGGGASVCSGSEQDGRGLCHRHGDPAGRKPELDQYGRSGLSICCRLSLSLYLFLIFIFIVY